MKTNLPILFLLCAVLCCLTGCAHTARHYTAPDSSRLVAAQQKLRTAVTEARKAAVNVSTGVKAVRANHAEQGAIIDRIGPQLAELARVAPPELMPRITGIEGDLEQLRSAHTNNGLTLVAVSNSEQMLSDRLQEAELADASVKKLTPEYETAVAKLTAQANASEEARAKDSKALWWYRVHFWLSWIVAGLGVAVCVLIAFLKFTGRLTIAAASAAGRVT